MPVPIPSRRRPLLRRLVQQPWSRRARLSPALRRWCDKHSYITPHFTWSNMACTDGTPVPASLRANARRHCFNLERFRHAIGDVGIAIDGPFRTEAKNRQVHGAADSRHLHADASDHFVEQVDRWVRTSHLLDSRGDAVRIAERIFPGVGNETSGTLHLDSRPGPWARFVTWRGV
jgi:hypothetical protein